MRKRVGFAAGLALLAAAVFGPGQANAMALPAAAAVKEAAGAIDPIEAVHCRLVWRCGYYGCGWRRVCWAPPYYGGGYGYYRPPAYYRPYGYYGGGPYYRPYLSYGPGPGYYRPYAPPPWVSGPYFVRRYYY